MSDGTKRRSHGGTGEGLFKVLANPDSLKAHFEGQHIVSIAAGTTCAYYGDGRDIRDFLVAANAVEVLRKAGHIVHFFLFDDNLDPLQYRQLKVAVDKDPVLLEKFAPYCGQPIAHIPSPYGDYESFSQHFQRRLMKRLSSLGCQPNLISASMLYSNGAYLPFTEQIIEKEPEIREFLKAEFPGYTLDRLYHPICPLCSRIDSTRLVSHDAHSSAVHCTNCGVTHDVQRGHLQGKLSWKIDLALRWWVFNIDAEPFTKRYLEPVAGSFAIALSLSRRFFGPAAVSPILVGMVHFESKSYSPFIDCLPSATLVKMFTDRWGSDLRITNDRLVLEAGRTPVYEGESFLNVVKRHVPVWALNPLQQDSEIFDLLKRGKRFGQTYLEEELGGESLDLSILDRASDNELIALVDVLGSTLLFRAEHKQYEDFDGLIRPVTDSFDVVWSSATVVLRNVLGQTRGLPGRRLLYHLPLETIHSVQTASRWLLASRGVHLRPHGQLLY